MCIEVQGGEIPQQEFCNRKGWSRMGQRMKTPITDSQVTRQSRSTTKKYVRNVRTLATKAARMPDVLPKEEIKVVVQPQGGVNSGRN